MNSAGLRQLRELQPLRQGLPHGGHCQRCAFEISIDGAPATLLPIDRNRCRWASMYALSNKDGFQYNGSELDLPVPDVIDATS